MRLWSSLLRLSPVIACALVASWAPRMHAATFPDLYTVTIAPDPAATEADYAVRAAMARLLIRVTGNRGAPEDPALQPLLASPRTYLSSSGQDRQGRALFGFSRSQVERSLTDLGQPVWGPERPLTLLWIAVDDGAGGRALLGAGDGAELGGVPLTPQMSALMASVRTEIAAAADERGLPVAWPLLDLQDLGAVTFLDVWGGFEEGVVAASARYRADAILIGRVRPGLFGTEVEWLFVHGIERRALPVGGIRDGLDAAADSYAADLATTGGASRALLSVRGVRTPADYGRVVSYLERQSVLQSVDVESFENGTLTLRVIARGDPRVLGRVLALGGVLRPASSASSFDSLAFEVVADGFAQ